MVAEPSAVATSKVTPPPTAGEVRLIVKSTRYELGALVERDVVDRQHDPTRAARVDGADGEVSRVAVRVRGAVAVAGRRCGARDRAGRAGALEAVRAGAV